ncbi:connector enhancer of kinase suppressor of ras 2-like [Ptychodera flava]|uniref:connector enhancer of kinase suppressor of ras 2-like n=1 Tax=Ptychodera flava TaxID=63121 RepID=UPI00396A7FAD
MAFINIRSWTTQEVAEWMKGLDDCLSQYVTDFVEKGVSGEKLLQVTQQDLEQLGVVKIGHQEILFQSLSLLCGLNFGLENENLQYLSLALSCKANNLKSLIKCNKFCTHFQRFNEANSKMLPNDVLKLVSEVVIATRTLVSWLDRSPFSRQDHFRKLRKEIVQLGLELTTSVQMDSSASDIEDAILPVSVEIVDLCDRLIKESKDPLVIQPAQLELTTLKKKRPDESLGMMIKATYEGVHVITGTKDQSPADLSRKVHPGDEVVQVNYRTVVGWQLSRLVEALKEDPHEVTLTLKKRPKNTLIPGQVLIKKSVLNVNERKKHVHTAPGRRRQNSTEKKLKSPLEQLFIPPPPEEPYSPRTASDEPLQSFSIAVPDSPNYRLDKQFELEKHIEEESLRLQSRRCTVSEVTLRNRRTSGGVSRSQHIEGRPRSLPADTADLTEVSQSEVKAWESISLEKRNSLSQESKSSEQTDSGAEILENKQTFTNQIEVYIVGSQDSAPTFHNQLEIADIAEKVNSLLVVEDDENPLIKTSSIEHIIGYDIAVPNGTSSENNTSHLAIRDQDSASRLRSSIRLQTGNDSGLKNDMLRSSIRLQTGNYKNGKHDMKDINQNTAQETNTALETNIELETKLEAETQEINTNHKPFVLLDTPKPKTSSISSKRAANGDQGSLHQDNSTVPKIKQPVSQTENKKNKSRMPGSPEDMQSPGSLSNGNPSESLTNEHSESSDKFLPLPAGYDNRYNPRLDIRSPSIRSDVSTISTLSSWSTLSSDSYQIQSVGGGPARIPDEVKPEKVRRRKKRPNRGGAVSRRISCKDLGMGECEGWLYKKEERRGFGNKWSKRWCVLKDYSVFIFKDKSALIASGVISLPGYKISQASHSDTKRAHAFKVSHPKVRDFIFASETLHDMSKWMNKLGLAAITYNYKEEEEKQRRLAERTISESTEPPPTPSTPASPVPYYSESEGEDDKMTSPTSSETSSNSDLSKDLCQSGGGNQPEEPLVHRVQESQKSPGETEDHQRPELEVITVTKNVKSEGDDEETVGQTHVESQPQIADCTESELQGQQEDQPQLESPTQDDAAGKTEVGAPAEVQDQTESQAQSEDQDPSGPEGQRQMQTSNYVEGRATVTGAVGHSASGDVNKSDGLLRLYGSVKSAKVKVGGVESAIRKQNMSQPERLRTFSIMSRDPKKNKKLLEKRALERTLKAKEGELHDIEKLLDSNITGEALKEWKEQHADLFVKRKDDPWKSKKKAAERNAKSSPKASPKASPSASPKRNPVSEKKKKKQKQLRKSAKSERESDMYENNNDEDDADDKSYHETHL